MQPLETQPDPELKQAYFDPDAADVSEQHFAASLEAEIEKPAFVVDTVDAAATARLASPPSELILEGRASRPSAADATINDAPLPEPADPTPDWRDQVSAKVNNYKSRKTPKVRYPSTASPPGRTDELADPVLDRPRIVEAPALIPRAPALGGILIEQASEPEPERRPGFDMPLQPAPLTRRLLAGALDALLVGAALAVFAYFFLRLNGPVQQPRLALQLTATLVAILWPAYQYAFLVFTGTTPGLRLTRLGLTHFDGAPTSRKLRRWRVLASLLSCVSLGLGYAWCFLDEDQLSWHDRITRTHIAPVSSANRS